MAKTIIHDESGNAKWGGEDHLKIAEQKTFTEMIFELLSERTPSPEELKIFELILNLSIDHGPETPSAIPTIEAAKEGKPIGEAVGIGISHINDTHGGAIEPAMELFYQIKNGENAEELVKDYLDNHKLIGGFGHRIYKEKDPRAEIIFEKLREANIGVEFIEIARQVKDAILKQKEKDLPINIDGAIACALCGYGWDKKLAKAVFIIARTPGLCGQYLNSL